VAFPATRLRRLRKTGVLRGMVRETELTPSHLVQPFFVQLGEGDRTPVEAMPGVERLSISQAVEDAGAVHALGVPAVLLFGLPAEKDEQASGAYDDEGVVQLAVRAIKDAALAALSNGRDGDEGQGQGRDRSAGLGGSAPAVARWLGDIRTYFPSPVVQVMQADAVERLGLRQQCRHDLARQRPVVADWNANAHRALPRVLFQYVRR
jgi:hypothetical protein